MPPKLKKEELQVERIRRSGPGGQHRNKKATGIRLTHIPTGMVIMATTERSQKLNLQKAIDTLIQRLKKLNQKPKKRVATKPSKATKQKRIDEKKKQSEKKQQRQKVKL
ncbi:MAG TPA: peptide chain release factor-like protein [Oligoflexia bacterium]|nr:peptide chain release factor-like protein [Oligoflexia bacterium]HMR25284.1 peptide chain release factor-like protein [Oligoflexia bacterium]